ncbi:hypothetical protein REG_1172 [Candidatus Regiella insecticola LSR1]|uniref:Uncharacterized protein n=1 Tax=Candidatus Regiella insecticola LSR1 TaxID=663321 RepID=E0WT29_9ENTR|nr:hypothetical protein REG_1172 [Candidatus Regiella insecticola LSR1]
MPLGGQEGGIPMSVDRLRDSASTRSQQRGGFKGERYKRFIPCFKLLSVNKIIY